MYEIILRTQIYADRKPLVFVVFVLGSHDGKGPVNKCARINHYTACKRIFGPRVIQEFIRHDPEFRYSYPT